MSYFTAFRSLFTRTKASQRHILSDGTLTTEANATDRHDETSISQAQTSGDDAGASEDIVFNSFMTQMSQSTPEEAMKQLTHMLPDPDKALVFYQKFLSKRDSVVPPLQFLMDLAKIWALLYERSGELGHIDKCLEFLSKAKEVPNPGHENSLSEDFISLRNLEGQVLMWRFKRLGDVNDIQGAIVAFTHALDSIEDSDWNSKAGVMSNLGNSLLRRFEQLGNLADLDNSILRHQQAVDLTPHDHPDKPGFLNNLGFSLLCRFQRLGDVVDLNNSILNQQQAADLTSHDHPNKPLLLTNLGNSFFARFERLGDLVDIDCAILNQQQAVDIIPDGHPNKTGMLSNLGLSLLTRFERLGDLVDLNNSILRQQQAADLIPPGHPDKPAVSNNLGNALLARFDLLGDLVDLDSSILNQQQAVDLTGDGHPDEPFWLSNLGNSLRKRFVRVGDLADIDRAIFIQQQAVDLIPDGHPNKPSLLNNLGNSLLGRFKRLGDSKDLDTLIDKLQQAVDLTPENHPTRPGILDNLGFSLRTRHHYLDNQGDTTRLVICYRDAALSPSGKSSLRFSTAKEWARLVYPDLEPYRVIIGLIPQVVWLGRTIEQRYKDLQTLGDAVMEAVSAACASEAYDLALEWLEQGRAIIWGQILLLRSPVDHLKMVHPELAMELNRVAVALEVASTTDSGIDKSTLSLERAAQEHRRLAEKWESLIGTIQALPDFVDFLRPKSASALKKSFVDGTIVIINVSGYRSDALILRLDSTSVEHVHLASLSLKKLIQARKHFEQSLRAAGVRVRDAERGSKQRTMQEPLINILKMLWIDVTKPVLDYLGYTALPAATSGDLPRITWCLTGPLACLPIHAAGLYDTSGTQDKLFNYVVSSYTPSLTALLERLERNPTSARSILAITQEATPNLSRLPGTMIEVDQVQGQMKGNGILMTRQDGEQATVKAVSEAMNGHSWVHLSCHAHQDTTEPTKSAFFLHDGKLELAEIMKKPLKQAELAYLSACQTATGDSTLPDEAMHLAAGMFITGYRSVVGTLWAIRDDDAPLVARVFYERLLSNPDAGVARALHEAVAALRNSKTNGEKDLISWVPYIHIGH